MPDRKKEEPALDGAQALQVSMAAAGGTSVTIQVSNPTGAAIRFCRYHTPFEGVRNDIFRVSQGGRELGYQGMMAKRRPPGPADYLLVEPGASMEATVDLVPSWSLKKGTWTVQYRGTGISGLQDSSPLELVVK